MHSTLTYNAPVYVPSGCAHVAVYGTLRAGGVNDIRRLANDVRLLGTTQLRGTLYDLGWYPGLVLGGERAVLAEVYTLSAPLEQALDQIEGLWPQDLGEYRKRVLSQDVVLADGSAQRLSVLTYEATPRLVAGQAVIDATDWLAWYEASGRGRPAQFWLNSTAPSPAD